MRVIFWVICILACLIAGVVLFVTITISAGAPQEAAGAAIACAIVIIPYVLARAVEGLSNKT
ncbi:MAG: hypothetical protein JNM78_10865 [Cyclobacteriaceae bacterium]|nr:hypothetical protein [Cyclobacteriaceae bacterium]